MTITISLTGSGDLAAATAVDGAPDPVEGGSPGAHQGGVEPDRSEGAREVTGVLDSDNLAAPPDGFDGTDVSVDADGGAPPMALEALDAIADSSDASTSADDVPDD